MVLTGKLNLLETMEFFKKCSFMISNDTGAIHMAAAVGLPIVGIYSIRDIFGSWFPFGNNHKILYHKFLDCDYKNENCIKKSVDLISIKEVEKSCDKIINYKNE